MLSFDDSAWEQYLYWRDNDKKMLKRINSLIKDIKRKPFEGIGNPEPLKHNLVRILVATYRPRTSSGLLGQ